MFASLGLLSGVSQVVLVYFLLRGPLARYFPLFLYVLSNLLGSLPVAWYLRQEGVSGPHYFSAFWGGEILLGLLLFVLVVSLTTRALEGSPMRPAALRLLSIVLLIALALPFVAFDSPVFSARWNRSVVQLYNFGAAIMNLVLWTALLVSRRRDPQLLTVSAGLGVLVAGAAITLGVRQFSDPGGALQAISEAAKQLAYLAGFLIWCWAFRPWGHQSSPPPTATAVG